jgi:hypothetical protein
LTKPSAHVVTTRRRRRGLRISCELDMNTSPRALPIRLGEPSSTTQNVIKAGSTDAIKCMLREQKKECTSLHANPLFREFRSEQYKHKKDFKAGDAGPPVIDDLDAGMNTTGYLSPHQSACRGLPSASDAGNL